VSPIVAGLLIGAVAGLTFTLVVGIWTLIERKVKR
jgi:hypothetical protein